MTACCVCSAPTDQGFNVQIDNLSLRIGEAYRRVVFSCSIPACPAHEAEAVRVVQTAILSLKRQRGSPSPGVAPPTSLLDQRVPQPGRESDYGVPPMVVAVSDVLYSLRNEVADEFVGRIDEALLTLLRPWTSQEEI